MKTILTVFTAIALGIMFQGCGQAPSTSLASSGGTAIDSTSPLYRQWVPEVVNGTIAPWDARDGRPSLLDLSQGHVGTFQLFLSYPRTYNYTECLDGGCLMTQAHSIPIAPTCIQTATIAGTESSGTLTLTTFTDGPRTYCSQFQGVIDADGTDRYNHCFNNAPRPNCVGNGATPTPTAPMDPGTYSYTVSNQVLTLFHNGASIVRFTR